MANAVAVCCSENGPDVIEAADVVKQEIHLAPGVHVAAGLMSSAGCEASYYVCVSATDGATLTPLRFAWSGISQPAVERCGISIGETWI